MSTGLERLYDNYIRSHIDPALNRLTELGVPHLQIREKVTRLALPQIKLVAWLALVMSPAPSVMIVSAALVFVFEPCLTKRFRVLKDWLGPVEGCPQTSLEAFANTFFNHRAPEITEIETKLKSNGESQELRDRLAYLRSESNQLSASQQAFFFGASLFVAHLLPGPLLYPFAIIFGGLVGDHLYRAALRMDTTEKGSEPVYGNETLIQACTKPVENATKADEPPPIEWTFDHAWTLLSEHVTPLLHPITETCESNGIPLVQLIRKTYALAVPKVKCIACIAILTLASPAVTLPYVTALVASIWLIFDSLGGPMIKPLKTGETYLEGCVRFFDNQKITLQKELAENTRIIDLLETQHTSNLGAIGGYETQASQTQGSISGEYAGLIAKRTTQNAKIEGALEAYRARNIYLEKQNPREPTSIERQAAIFAVAYVAAALIGHCWLYYGLVSIGGGILLGNHVYHWANREEGWEVVQRER